MQVCRRFTFISNSSNTVCVIYYQGDIHRRASKLTNSNATLDFTDRAHFGALTAESAHEAELIEASVRKKVQKVTKENENNLNVSC